MCLSQPFSVTMAQKKYVWVPFLFGLFLIRIIQKEVSFLWFSDTEEEVSSDTDHSEEKLTSSSHISLREILSSSDTENPLDNCNFVYLDMGTNFGVQIR